MPISLPEGPRKPRNCPHPAPSGYLVAFRRKGDMSSEVVGMQHSAASEYLRSATDNDERLI